MKNIKIMVHEVYSCSPMSRAQAKDLCDKLEKFKEIELDFSDVEWIGQGFAHQLFVVFKNNHPDVKIIPQNMNDAVRRMYNHVVNSRLAIR